jgi:D-aspartate ligase
MLLANAGWYGTLAATRALGEQGVPVYICDHGLLSASRWSRHAVRALHSPPLADPERFLEWLIAFGEREPGVVLYPTSDEATFLYALHRRDLSRTFRMYHPDVDVVLHVLDKKRLYETARSIGIDVPETWFPDSDADVARIAREAPMPMLVKPRTQVLAYSSTKSKGVVVHERDELVARYRAFVNKSRYHRVITEPFPEAGQAMLQRYVPEAAERIYVLAAFIDKSGQYFAARSAIKVFQQPRRLGIGLCFEDAPLEPALADAARRLAKATGYFGLFQLEFIKEGDRYLLIDLNPRFYNQLAFDVARGLPIPSITYAAATGDDQAMIDMLERAKVQPAANGRVFCNRFGFKMMVATQRLVGRMSADEASRWRRWYQDHRGASIDPAISSDDRVPGIVDVASQIIMSARHPRGFLQRVVLDDVTR